MPPIQVAAALILRAGSYLICQRRPDAHLGGLWEFPGGKREAGESLEDCLRRELREELGIEVSAPTADEVVTHDYGDRRIELHFFRCAMATGEPRPLGCAAWRWAPAASLRDYAFPPADQLLIDRLVREGTEA